MSLNSEECTRIAELLRRALGELGGREPDAEELIARAVVALRRASGVVAFQDDQLVSRTVLRKFVPVSDMTLFRWIRNGEFPKPIDREVRKDGKPVGARYWRLSDLDAWLAARSKGRQC